MTEQEVLAALKAADTDEEKLRIEAEAITATDNSARDGDPQGTT